MIAAVLTSGASANRSAFARPHNLLLERLEYAIAKIFSKDILILKLCSCDSRNLNISYFEIRVHSGKSLRCRT